MTTQFFMKVADISGSAEAEAYKGQIEVGNVEITTSDFAEPGHPPFVIHMDVEDKPIALLALSVLNGTARPSVDLRGAATAPDSESLDTVVRFEALGVIFSQLSVSGANGTIGHRLALSAVVVEWSNGDSADTVAFNNETGTATENTSLNDNPLGYGADHGAGGPSDLRFFMKMTEGGTTRWLEIEGFDFAMSGPHRDLVAGGGNAHSSVEFSELSITRFADDASLQFAHLADTMAAKGQVDIQVFQDIDDGDGQKWQMVSSMTFANDGEAVDGGVKPFVSSMNEAEPVGGRAVETVSFGFTQYVQVDYAETPTLGPDGLPILEKYAEIAWDIGLNKVGADAEPLEPAPVDPATGELPPALPPGQQVEHSGIAYTLTITVGSETLQFDLGSYDLEIQGRLLTFSLANDAETLLFTKAVSGSATHAVTIEARDDNNVLVSKVALTNADLLALDVSWTEQGSSKGLAFSFAHHDASLDWQWLNANDTMSGATLAHGDGTLRLGGPLPQGGGAGLPSGGGAAGLDQHAFMQISANGQTAWLPIEDFAFNFESAGGSYHQSTLNITRLYDDAGALISQLAASGSSSPGGFVTVKIVVFDNVDVDGPDLLWVPVAQYEFGRATIVSDQMVAGGEFVNFATQELSIEFELFAEQHNTSDPGDYDPADRSGHRIDLRPALPVVTDWTSAPPTVPVDQETGELIDGSQVGFDPLVDLSPGSGLQIFIKISLAGNLIDSGDGVLDVAYGAQNTYFAVNTFTFQPGAYGEPAQALLTLGDSQNWVELLRRMHVTPTADFEIEIVAIDHPGGVVGKQIWKLATDSASISMSTEGASSFKAFTVTLAPEPGQTFTYQVLESSDGHGPGAAVTSTFTRTGDGYDAGGLAFNTPGVQQGFGNAWLHPGNTEGTSSGDYTIVLRLPDGEFFEISDFSYNREWYLNGSDLDWRGQINFATALNSNANLFAYYAATGTVLDQIEVEVWLAGQRYFGLTDYTFKDVKFVTQTVSFGENPMAVLSLTFDGYTMAAAKADPGTGEIDPDGWTYYDSSAPLATYTDLAVQERPVFDGIEDPVLLESGGSFARSAPAFMASFVGGTTFISVQDAADAANPGDIVRVRNDLARDLDVVVHVENLTFDVEAGLELKLTLGATIPGGVPIQDVIVIGLGTVTVNGNDVANVIAGGEGIDIINGGFGDDTIHGGDGNDIITDGLGQSSQGADNINGGEGDDTIIVTWADTGDVFDGGGGNDTLDLSGDNSGYTVLLGGTFSDWGATFSNFENLNGNQGTDTVTGSSGANRIFGNGGNDTLNGLAGDDTLDGGIGSDVLHGGENNDTLTDADTDPASIDQLFGDAGDDTIVVHGPVAGEVFDGGADRDLLDLSHATVPFAGANAIDLGAASFTAYDATFSNFEDVTGSNGDDAIIGSSGVNAINGGGGDDVIDGGDGEDVIDGGAGDDMLTDGAAGGVGHGRDEIFGGADNDTIRVRFAASGEIFDGGDGIDTLDVSGEVDPYDITLGVAEHILYDASFRNFENFIGTSLGDTVIGHDGANVVDGGAGTDTINTLGGADGIIDSDQDFDTIDAGAGNDMVRVQSQAASSYDGGADRDLLDLSGRTAGFTGAGKINLGAASFTNLGSTFTNFENVLGTTHGDQIIGSGGDDELDGNAGIDTIDAAGGNDIIWDMDTDKDTIKGGGGNDTIIVKAAGTDAYEGGTGVDTLDLSHSDQQYVGANAVRLTGTFYYNAAASFRGFENVIGTMFADDIFGSRLANDIDGGSGSDVVRAGNGSDTLRDSDDAIDSLYGHTGNDTFIIEAIADFSIYDGGGGQDLLDLSALGTGSFGIDRQLDLRGTGAFLAVTGFERVIATEFADWIIGTELAEEINGGGGSDTIMGNGGNDVLIGGAGADALLGGAGLDTASYALAGAGVVADLTDSSGNEGDAAGDTYELIENLTGSGFDDELTGTSGANVILGGAGDDIITGGALRDAMNGGAGADTFVYTASNDSIATANRDVIQGWEAIDKIDLSALDASQASGLQHFTFLGEGDNSLTMATGTLKYYQENGRTFVVANLNANTAVELQIEIVGYHSLTSENFLGLDRAILTGGPAGDILMGTDGDDILTGGGGVDTLEGQGNGDILNGGVRGDIMSGGAGSDRFVYTALSESAPPTNVDIINDWDSSDIIDLGDVDAQNVAGIQHFVFQGFTANPASIARGELQFFHEGGNTIVIGGFDADDPPEFQIQIAGEHNLTAANFDLV